MNVMLIFRPLILLSFLICSIQVNAVEVAGYSFKAPADWKSSPPSNKMRKAQFSVPGKDGKNGEVSSLISAEAAPVGSKPTSTGG